MPHDSRSPIWTGRIAACGFVALLFCSILPTLNWVEFHYGVERLVAQTALETRRDGHWLIPRMEGEPRVRKPPLVAWLSAAAVREGTIRLLDSPDPVTRDAAYHRLALQIRLPTLAAACLAVYCIYEMGRMLGGPVLGMLSMLVAATSVYFVTFCRVAITDTHLLLWVTVANVCLAAVLLRGQWWAATGAGVALGLAMMTKGPVCLLQTIVPAASFVVWQHWRRTDTTDRAEARPATPVAALLAGAVLMILIGGAWFAYVAIRHPDVWRLWLIEVLRTDPSEKATGTRLDYLSILAFMMPWSIFLVGGLTVAFRALLRCERDNPILLALAWVVVPILIMSLFRDRKERYLLPLLGPASVLAGAALLRVIRAWRLDTPARFAVALQWAGLLVIVIGFPVAAASGRVEGLTTVTGEPWFGRVTAALLATAGVVLIVSMLLWSCRRREAIVAATVLVVLCASPVYIWGFGRSFNGHSELKPLADLIRARAPDAIVYHLTHAGGKQPPQDLAIYLNRNRVSVPTESRIPQDNRPQIYVRLWRAGDVEPTPATGWRLFGRVPRDGKDWWVAFIRP